jgi:hypothetical protein
MEEDPIEAAAHLNTMRPGHTVSDSLSVVLWLVLLHDMLSMDRAYPRQHLLKSAGGDIRHPSALIS